MAEFTLAVRASATRPAAERRRIIHISNRPPRHFQPPPAPPPAERAPSRPQIIKPEAMASATTVMRMIKANGFTVVAQDVTEASPETISALGVDGLAGAVCMPVCLAKAGGISQFAALIASTATSGVYASSAGTAARDVRAFFPRLKTDKLPSNAEAEVRVSCRVARQCSQCNRSALTPPWSQATLNAEVVPMLTKALMELCKAKPENPVLWLANQLKQVNPAGQVLDSLGPEEQMKVEAAHDAFALIDADDDGLIDRTEFCGALRKLGLEIDQASSDVIFGQIDRDGDGPRRPAAYPRPRPRRRRPAPAAALALCCHMLRCTRRRARCLPTPLPPRRSCVLAPWRHSGAVVSCGCRWPRGASSSCRALAGKNGQRVLLVLLVLVLLLQWRMRLLGCLLVLLGRLVVRGH